MSRKVFVALSIAVVMGIGFVAGSAVSTGNVVLPVLAMAAGIILLRLFRGKVKEVVEDERSYRISEKASRNAIQVFGISAAVLGSVLIALGSRGTAGISQAGYTLSYSVCSLLIIYQGFYWYYNKRCGSGGKNEEQD